MRGGRGQVTLFVILGLVLLFVVGIILLLLRKPPSAAPTTIDIATSEVLGNYIGTCLNTVVTDELRNISASGGLSVLQSRNGRDYATVSIDGQETQILYGITRNRREPGDLIPWRSDIPHNGDMSTTPSTPDPFSPTLSQRYWDGTQYRPLDWFLHGYFGEVSLIAPCSKTGVNGPGSNIPCRYYPGSPPGTPPGESLQDALAAEITRRVEGCVSLRQFTEAVGQNVTNLSRPTVTLKLTPDNVLVQLEYRVMLTGRTESVTVPIERRYNVRLLAITQYAMDLARQETRDVEFDIADTSHYKDKARIPSYDPSFEVRRDRIAAAQLQDMGAPQDIAVGADLITITDSASLLAGEAYSFSFLVEHRPPMLDETYVTCDVSVGRDPDDLAIVAASDATGDCKVTDADGETN